MIIIIVNILLAILLFYYYVTVKKHLQKGVFFEVSLLYFYKLTVFPILFFIVNFLIFYFYYYNWLIIAFIPLIIPLSKYIFRIFSLIQGKKEYGILEPVIFPIVQNEFLLKNLHIDNQDISIRIKNKIDKRKELDIVIYYEEHNDSLKSIEESIQRKIILINETSKYLPTVIIKLPYKKKGDGRLNPCLM